MKSKTKRFGILTAGGDAPGLNPAIRGICKAAQLEYDMEIVGIHDGFVGLVEGRGDLLRPADYSGIIHKGGTILGTSRARPFKDEAKVKQLIYHYNKWQLDCLVCLGGNGTQKRANLAQQAGLNVIHLPKTIDNDVFGTDMSFGFHTALEAATDAVDRLHTTAASHKRILIAEIMGNSAGWLALYSGIAGGADVIVIPEIPYDINKIKEHLDARMMGGAKFSVIVIAEGAKTIDEAELNRKELKKKYDGKPSAAFRLAEQLKALGDYDTRVSVLGYIQRGGAPVAYDRMLATQLGTKAAELMAKGNYGNMVALKGMDIVAVPLDKVAGKTKHVPHNHISIKSAKLAGTTFGD